MKIGVIGNGKIVQIAMQVMRMCNIEITALWCRNAERGKPLCDEFKCTLYTDYDAFLKDPSFDTVYVGLINSLHYEYTKKALSAKKHCIVEKPFTTTYREAEELYEQAKNNNVYLFEAIMSRYSRNYEAIRRHLSDVGNIRMVRGSYCQYSSRYNDYKQGKVLPAFDPALSGGSLYDINVYNIHFAAGLFGMPQRVRYSALKGFNGVDTSGTAVLDYDGFISVCMGAKDCNAPSGTVIQGDLGYIEIPGRPGFVHNVTLHLNDGTETVLDEAEETNPMAVEFLRIAEVLDAEDQETADQWMRSTLDVMKILTEARKDANIFFACDEA